MLLYVRTNKDLIVRNRNNIKKRRFPVAVSLKQTANKLLGNSSGADTHYTPRNKRPSYPQNNFEHNGDIVGTD